MGQYFAAVNTDKQEFVCPWCIGGVAKLWEWAANRWGAIFTLLLRKSDSTGGGDYGCRPRACTISEWSSKNAAGVLATAIAQEGRPVVDGAMPSIVGRWAGDRIALIGDYDSSKLWRELYDTKTYRNISRQLVETWNDFIEIDDMKLKYAPCSSCAEQTVA